MTQSLVSASFPEQDYLIIGGERSPGLAIITGGNKAFGWQVNKGTYLSGATVVPTGDELAEFTVQFILHDENDYPLWEAYAKKYFAKALFKVPGSADTTYALGIKHPILNGPPLNIDKVVVKKITPMLNDGTGLWTATVDFLQYRKPVPALGKPPAAIPSAATPKPTATTATQKLIQQRQAELEALGGKP